MDNIIYECPHSCHKYSKSIGEIYEAGKKHKEKLLTVIELCENQKTKNSSLKEEKNTLLDKVDQLELDGKQHADLIDRQTKEIRELKIKVRDIRMVLVEQEEIIRETTEHDDLVGTLKIKVKDLEDEIEVKNIKIQEMDSDMTNANERATKAEHLDKELNEASEDKSYFENKVKALQMDLKRFKSKEQSQHLQRNNLFEQMDVLSESRLCLMEGIKKKIDNLKTKYHQRCWFGKRCRRLFCRFDHSFLFRKVNRQENVVSDEIQVDIELQKVLCEECGEVYENMDLIEHIQTMHEQLVNEKENHACTECSFVCTSRFDLNIHVINKHKKNNEIECEQCGNFFVTREELKIHRKTHDDVNREMIALSQNLQRLLDKKSEEPQKTECFECKTCSEDFVSKQSLRKHTQKKHYEQKENKGTQRNNKVEQNFECGMCVITFDNGEDMNQHMDLKHEGRWKYDDPDVITLGDDYDESDEDDSDVTTSSSDESEILEEENPETQSGEDVT